jgi:hypothetical protein
MAHLVFLVTQADPQQNQKSHFLLTHRQINVTLLIIKSSFTWNNIFDSINLSKIDKSDERNDWTIH